MNNAAAKKILFVDDDPSILDAMKRNLRKQFDLDTAIGPDEALRFIESDGPYAVVVADMSMPVMNGAELLEVIRARSPDTVRIMLTGNADRTTATEAVNRGNVFRFLTKPCPHETVAAMVDTALKQHELIVIEKALLNQTLKGALQVLTDILATLDTESFGQAQLRRRLARELASRLGLSSTWDIEIAALLSEIGRVTLPVTLREKSRTQRADTLNLKEQNLLTRIPEFSSQLLATIPRLGTIAQAVLYQNKNYDGSGFPVDNIARAEIPIGGRILRVVNDVVRMHEKGLAIPDIVTALKAGPERYDPTVVRELAASGSVLLVSPKTVVSNMRNATLAELVPGCRLLADISTPEGKVVVGVGTILNATQLQRLRNFAQLNPVQEPIAIDLPPTARRQGSQSLDEIEIP